jgi:hypothetical protein
VRCRVIPWSAQGFGRYPLRAAGTEDFEPMRVLIVEDEAMVALELEELLLDEGFDVVGRASDAAQAIGLGRRHRPDVALLDLNLADGLMGPRIAKTPCTNGLQQLLLRRARRTYYRPTCTERSASSRSPVLAGLWLKPYVSCRPICVVRRRSGLCRPCFVLHPRHSNDGSSKQGRPKALLRCRGRHKPCVSSGVGHQQGEPIRWSLILGKPRPSSASADYRRSE